MTKDPICFEEIQIVQAPGFETGGFPSTACPPELTLFMDRTPREKRL
jgi:hypothetical protein